MEAPIIRRPSRFRHQVDPRFVLESPDIRAIEGIFPKTDVVYRLNTVF